MYNKSDKALLTTLLSIETAECSLCFIIEYKDLLAFAALLLLEEVPSFVIKLSAAPIIDFKNILRT